jgi:hypothetical protein
MPQRLKRSQIRVEENNRLTSGQIDWTDDRPFQFEFPESRDLAGLEPEEYYFFLKRFGLQKKWPDLTADMSFYISNLSNIPFGTPQWEQTVEELFSRGSKAGLKSMCRTAYRQISTIDAMDGNTAGELIWIADGDENTCVHCAARGGDVGTIQYHAAKGLPGPATCEGGSWCRCSLAAID